MLIRKTVQFIFLHQVFLRNVEGHKYKGSEGKKMTGQVLETRNLTSVTWCAVLCGSNKDCWSFNYGKKSNLCELNGGLEEPVIVEAEDTNFYSKQVVNYLSACLNS